MHTPLTLDPLNPQFWVAVLQIVLIDILLSGDNAVVIALACRKLSGRQRKLGIIWGVGGAIGLRVVLTFFAVTLLTLNYVKLVGSALLLWIGIKLVLPQQTDGGQEIKAAGSLLSAIRLESADVPQCVLGFPSSVPFLSNRVQLSAEFIPSCEGRDQALPQSIGDTRCKMQVNPEFRILYLFCPSERKLSAFSNQSINPFLNHARF